MSRATKNCQMAAKEYVKYLFKMIDRFQIYFMIFMFEHEIGFVDRGELNFD